MTITSKGLEHLGFTQSEFSLQDDGEGVYIKKWLSKKPQPSESDITTADKQAQAEYDSKQYARNRAVEYPEIKEQLDLLYKDMLADKGDKTGTWFAAVKAVKDKYAKE
jgi:hypothetical protein